MTLKSAAAVEEIYSLQATEQGNETVFQHLENLEKLTFLEQCISESIRLAQQSITLRILQHREAVLTHILVGKVLRPVCVGEEKFEVPPGFFLATVLSVTNCCPLSLTSVHSTPDAFSPQRYNKNKLEPAALQSKEKIWTVSTFGHGRHACVGERFAMSIMKIFLCHYLTKLKMRPLFERVEMIDSQIGAVARPAQPCRMAYSKSDALASSA